MNISFIWIEDFQDGLIEKQSFNFDSRFRYECKYKFNNQFELYIKANANYIQDFFTSETDYQGPVANIRNITAIIGQNGVGKSSILDYIKQSLVNNNDEDETDIEDEGKFLYILHKYEGTEPKYFVYHHPEMNVQINVSEGVDFYYEQCTVQKKFQGLDDTNFIYFSNIYDYKDEYEYISKKMLNISTNYLSSMPLLKQQREGTIESEGPSIKFKDVKRQIQFVVGIKTVSELTNLSFVLPDEVEASFSMFNRARNRNDAHIAPLIEELIQLIDRCKKRSISFSESRVKRRIMQCFLEHLLVEMCRDRHSITEEFTTRLKAINYSPYDFFDTVNKDEFYKIIRWILMLAESFRTIQDSEFKNLSNMLKANALLLIKIYKYLKKDLIKINFNRDRITFSLQMNELEKSDFIDIYEVAFIRDDFIRFYWRDMSSGEKAMLNIYSRFYFAANRLELTQEPENDLIILIDEGEVYLHPHWQSQLIHNLIEYLPVIFRNQEGINQRNIQIVLTSNSPFIISDLPSTSVIFLKKEKEKSVVLSGLEDYNQTFAANIHSLLAHSFFMQDGLIGAFAKRKINDLIHLLVNESIHDLLPYEEEIEKTINIIGEPVIRNKLSQMLKDKLSVRMLSVDQEIRELKSRLNELENWKRDTNQT
ncbi:AAA family ATPase [Bacillus pseudomycoides]|uniref:AAA family ATPase n=1 Tax=Bacillus pseudomycoides TaxID=64104 RepID=UPI003D6624FC